MDVTFYCQIDMPEGWYLRALIGVASGIGTPRMYQMRELYRARNPSITEESKMTDAELSALLQSHLEVQGDSGVEADDVCSLAQTPFRFSVLRGPVTILLAREGETLVLSLSGPLDDVAACARGVYCLRNFDQGEFSQRKLPEVWSSAINGPTYNVEKLLSEFQPCP